MVVPVGIASSWTYRNLRQVHSSPIPIRAQAAVLSRISSIRQLATDELREQRHLQGNHSNHQLATDDLRLASRGNSDLVGAARRDASPHLVKQHECRCLVPAQPSAMPGKILGLVSLRSGNLCVPFDAERREVLPSHLHAGRCEPAKLHLPRPFPLGLGPNTQWPFLVGPS